ncbi:MAG: ribbon-helix-helix protein, CopG family [bacterium]
MNKTLTIRISEKTKKELEELSRIENKPISDLVRDSLRRYLAIQRFRCLRNTVLPFAEAQGILTDDDIFKMIS